MKKSKNVMAKMGTFLIVSFGLVVFVMLFALAATSLVAWPVMLLLGAAHSMEPAIPALGFWLTFVIILIVRLVLPSNSKPDTDNKKKVM